MNDPDPEIAVVLTAYAAFARGDIDQAIAGLHPHVEWIEPGQFPYGGRRVARPRSPTTSGTHDHCGPNSSLNRPPPGGEMTSSSSTMSTAAWPTARSGM